MSTAHAAPRIDPRVLRTRRLLQDAVLKLVCERPMDEVTVGDIAERATVNRTTFYQHYRDTETLLADALDNQFAERLASQMNDPDAVKDFDPNQPPRELVVYFELVADNAALYRKVLTDSASTVAITRLRGGVKALLERSIEVCGDFGGPTAGATIPPEIAVAVVAEAIIGAVLAWLSVDPLPPASDAANWAWWAANAWRPGGAGSTGAAGVVEPAATPSA